MLPIVKILAKAYSNNYLLNNTNTTSKSYYEFILIGINNRIPWLINYFEVAVTQWLTVI